MKIAIGTDHRGVDFKKELMEKLHENYEFIDCSPENYETDDYTDYAIRVSKMVADGDVDLGILLCGTGIGMSIASNKIKGVRCALVHNEQEAILAREHNNANVIAMGTSNDCNSIKNCIEKFIETPFSDEEKHFRRVKKIIDFENGEYNGL